jgi:nucleoid DNA-binding protein
MAPKEFIKRMARRLGMTAQDFSGLYKMIIGEMKTVLSEGDDVVIPGFGRFYCEVLPAVSMLNRYKIRFGVKEYMDIPARPKLRFTPQKGVEDYVKFNPFNSEINTGTFANVCKWTYERGQKYAYRRAKGVPDGPGKPRGKPRVKTLPITPAQLAERQRLIEEMKMGKPEPPPPDATPPPEAPNNPEGEILGT